MLKLPIMRQLLICFQLKQLLQHYQALILKYYLQNVGKSRVFQIIHPIQFTCYCFVGITMGEERGGKDNLTHMPLQGQLSLITSSCSFQGIEMPLIQKI